MRYPNGEEVRLGDRVRLSPGNDGVVVCSIDTGEFSAAYPESDWAYLERGVLIESELMGLIHYLEPETTMTLLERRPSV
jgi:hypothetical protein